MTRQGFIDFNTRLSPENSRKASSYAMAIRILDEVLPHQSVIELHGQLLYDVHDVSTIDSLIALVRIEQAKMRRGEKSIFDYGQPNQSSYPLKSFCSAALKSLKQYALYEQEVMEADRIVAQETNPKTISAKLIAISPDNYSVILSSALQENETKEFYDKHFDCIKGQKLTLPTQYLPNRDFLAYHQEKVFVGA